MPPKIHEPSEPSEPDSRKKMPAALCMKHVPASRMEPVARVGEKLSTRDWYHCGVCGSMRVLSPNPKLIAEQGLDQYNAPHNPDE